MVSWGAQYRSGMSQPQLYQKHNDPIMKPKLTIVKVGNFPVHFDVKINKNVLIKDL
jgi:hypothetical protein